MGYTNYATYTARNKKTFPAQFTAEARRIVNKAQEGYYDGYDPIAITGWDGGDPPKGRKPAKIRVTRSVINLNGCGDESSENCLIESFRDYNRDFYKTWPKYLWNELFCKTHMYPYDAVVKALYLLAEKHGILTNIGWDGDREDDSYKQCVSLLKAADVEIKGVTDIPLEEQIHADKVKAAERMAAEQKKRQKELSTNV